MFTLLYILGFTCTGKNLFSTIFALTVVTGLTEGLIFAIAAFLAWVLVKISDNLYAKLETYSPSGSVKDRMISYVVKKALDRGEICEKTILCDATSGNTGIALSMMAASLGLRCVIFMPHNMSEERKRGVVLN